MLKGCHCDPGFAGSKDCKKPVASAEAVANMLCL